MTANGQAKKSQVEYNELIRVANKQTSKHETRFWTRSLKEGRQIPSIRSWSLLQALVPWPLVLEKSLDGRKLLAH